MDLIVKPDYLAVSIEAARIVADSVRRVPNIRLGLPTGRTPLGMYRHLIHLHRTERLDFSRVRLFHLDEYLGIRSDNPNSFKSYLFREFFNLVNVRRANIYLIDENYEQTIREAGGIDLLILGIGANGHLAFNEPGSAPDSRTRVVRLADSTIEGARRVFGSQELPHEAITVGVGTIMDARRILLMASGSEKAAILAKAIGKPVNAAIPASILQSHTSLTVIADEDASRLSHGSAAS
jgi:glucosamine-6-phosphate deaminase